MAFYQTGRVHIIHDGSTKGTFERRIEKELCFAYAARVISPSLLLPKWRRASSVGRPWDTTSPTDQLPNSPRRTKIHCSAGVWPWTTAVVAATPHGRFRARNPLPLSHHLTEGVGTDCRGLTTAAGPAPLPTQFLNF